MIAATWRLFRAGGSMCKPYIRCSGKRIDLAYLNYALCDGPGKRCFSSIPDESLTMKRLYQEMEAHCGESVNNVKYIAPFAVFVNAEVKLNNIHVYGFDYDYTLATYTHELDRFIFEKSLDSLISSMMYPAGLRKLEFNSNFAVRGLHFDVKKGLLMKVDSCNRIELDTVHRGFTKLPLAEIDRMYKSYYLPADSLKQRIDTQGPVLSQLMDFFVLSEANLLCGVLQYFEEEKLDYKPEYVHADVARVVRNLHKSGLLHNTIMEFPEKYIVRNQDLRIFLQNLANNKKKLFLVSNNSGRFIDKGMKFLVGEDWRNLFDVIIVGAHKPAFFTSSSGRFRRVDDSGTFKDWIAVSNFEKGQVYDGGSIYEMIRLTGWKSDNVLYFGDHVYADLADVSNIYGWTTAAVVPELEDEIEVINSRDYRIRIARLHYLENLIGTKQHVVTPEGRAILHDWRKERALLLLRMTTDFNPHFGSIFRSMHNASYFAQRLQRYAMMYTSRVTNLMQYPLNHLFYPRRIALPHESP